MTLSRRSFLASSAALTSPAGRLLAAPKKLAGLKIGVTDWNLDQTAKLDAVAMAAGLGFQGLEVSLGNKVSGDKLPLDNTELQSSYRAAAEKNKIALASTCLDILHRNYLKSDKLGQKWLVDAIRITKSLQAPVILMPFFGNGALKTPEEMNRVGDILREIAPSAEKAGVILGLEDTISAEDNVRIMDRSKSKAVKVFYDVGNSAGGGFDVVKEIRWLGKDRICQFHLKDKGYLGEGAIDFNAVMQAIADIGYRGFADLETNAPSHSIEGDMKRNLAYVRQVVGKVQQG